MSDKMDIDDQGQGAGHPQAKLEEPINSTALYSWTYAFEVPLLTLEVCEESEKKTIKQVERELGVTIEFERTTPHYKGFGNGLCRILARETLAIYRALALIVALVRLSSPARYCFWTHWLVLDEILQIDNIPDQRERVGTGLEHVDTQSADDGSGDGHQDSSASLANDPTNPFSGTLGEVHKTTASSQSSEPPRSGGWVIESNKDSESQIPQSGWEDPPAPCPPLAASGPQIPPSTTPPILEPSGSVTGTPLETIKQDYFGSTTPCSSPGEVARLTNVNSERLPTQPLTPFEGEHLSNKLISDEEYAKRMLDMNKVQLPQDAQANHPSFEWLHLQEAFKFHNAGKPGPHQLDRGKGAQSNPSTTPLSELPIENTELHPVEKPEPPTKKTGPPLETTEPPINKSEPPVENSELPVEKSKPSIETTEPPVEKSEHPPIVKKAVIKRLMEFPLGTEDYLCENNFQSIREIILESNASCRLSSTPDCLRFWAVGTEPEVSLAMVLISIKLKEVL